MRSRVVVVALFGCLLITASGCRIQRNYEAVRHDNGAERQARRERRAREIAAQRASYKELQGDFASKKLTIENHIATWKLSELPEDPLNVSQDQRIAAREILQAARELRDDASAAVANDTESFRYVKGSKKTSRSYLKFAEQTLEKYQHLEGSGSYSEPGMLRSEPRNSGNQ